jgi:hypothetical protein
VQAPVEVLHASVVHVFPSLQLAHAPPVAPHAAADSDASAVHAPAPSTPHPEVQHAPDSQRPPVHAVPFDDVVHAVEVVAELQIWQPFDGFVAPLA